MRGVSADVMFDQISIVVDNVLGYKN